MEEVRYRVMNKCNYTIGVLLPNGHRTQIQPGSFKLLTLDDILFIESICTEDKYFGKRMLVPVDANGKEIPFDQITAYIDYDPNPHMSDDEIENILKGTPKKLKAFLDGIEDPAELHAIFEIAKKMDLSSTRLKVLKEKMPDKDFLETDEEE